ncbi:MAG: radical SAM protein [Acidobacteriota bacterium]
MLTGIHFLLTYTCIYECDHCFLHCGPQAEGTFTLEQLRAVFKQIKRIPSVEMVYFEGGEAFLYYPLLIEGLRLARQSGLGAGIVTNAYWATSVDDAALWLKPLRALKLADLSISDDAFHESTEAGSPPKLALEAARKLGVPCGTICIGDDVYFRGRAAEKLTGDLPRRPCSSFTTCPHEELEQPERMHVDCHGNAHICQGVSMGNMWTAPLARLVREYNARAHPICGPLVAGGPLQLAREYGVALSDDYVDECHCCYAVRKALRDRFPEHLVPRQVYGLKPLPVQHF